MIVDLIVIGVMSIVAFVVMAIDAWRCDTKRSPVNEALLLIPAVLAGGFGTLCAMILLRRKVQATLFLVAVPLLAVVQVAIDALWRMHLIF